MSYALWHAELKEPMPDNDRQHRTDDPAQMCGFWRIAAAKTKADYPVAIWEQDGGVIGKIGLKVIDMMGGEGADFCQSSWLHCSAVTKEAYAQALETGFWADEKPARRMSAEEKLGIDTSPGDNQAPPDESLADQIGALADKAEAIQVSDQASADAATGLLDRLRLLLQKAEAERVSEKEPFLEGGRQVDAKWRGVRQPGLDASDALDKRRKDWLRAEQRRLDAEAAAERKRLQDIADAENERIRQENAKLLEESDQSGETVELAPEIAAPVVETPRAKAGTSFGRAIGLRKVKRAKITDITKLLAALATHPEMAEFAQTLANRAAKAGIPLEGMEIEEVLE